MKLRRKILQALAIASMILPPSLAMAQSGGPYYIAPKIMYSRQMMDNFVGSLNQPDTIAAKPEIPDGSPLYSLSTLDRAFPVDTRLNFNRDRRDNVFGGGVAVGYDFGSMGYAPFRTEIEFLARGAASGDFGSRYMGTSEASFATNVPSDPLDPASKQKWATVGRGYTDYIVDQKIKSRVYSLMGNVYYDIPTDTVITPYVGGGIGMAYIDTTTTGTYYTITGNSIKPFSFKSSQDTTNFAWQLGTGVSIAIRDNMAIDLGYRYSDFGKAEGGKGSPLHGYKYPEDWDMSNTGIPVELKNEFDMTAHEVTLGLRISAF